MHNRALRFVEQFASRRPLSVVEIGSRNVNGSVRRFWRNASWTGLDLYPGPMVDVVCDALDWSPPEKVELVVCCEVLEHAPEWRKILMHAAGWLKPRGAIIVTCASIGRPSHSAIDGGALRAGEYYENVHCNDLFSALWDAGFRYIRCEYDCGDAKAFARLGALTPR